MVWERELLLGTRVLWVSQPCGVFHIGSESPTGCSLQITHNKPSRLKWNQDYNRNCVSHVKIIGE